MGREERRDEHGPVNGDSTALEQTKATLRRLAGPEPAAVVDRAAAAVEDIDDAVAFVEDVGVDELARAVEAAEDPAVRARGQRALAAFRRFRAAAAGDLDDAEPIDGDADAEPIDGAVPAGHFHPGHDTDLRDGVETTTE